MRRLGLFVAAFALSVPPVLALAQVQAQPAPPEAKPAAHFYKLNFAIQELNEAGKVENTRSYVTTVSTSGSSFAQPGGQSIKTGARVPVSTGTENGATQIQYLDVGVNLDVRELKETGDKLGFHLRAEVSSLASEAGRGANELPGDPVVRQNSWDSTVLIPIGKPTVVYSSDDLEDKGRMQVEVTATLVQ